MNSASPVHSNGPKRQFNEKEMSIQSLAARRMRTELAANLKHDESARADSFLESCCSHAKDSRDNVSSPFSTPSPATPPNQRAKIFLDQSVTDFNNASNPASPNPLSSSARKGHNILQ